MKPVFYLLAATISPLLLSFSLQAADTPLVPHGSDWRYRKGTNEPPANWYSLADSELNGTWLTGPGGFGYGDGDDATVLGDMRGANGYVTVYTRQSFSIPAGTDVNAHLRLEVDYDDGFVAYLDGTEVARSANVPSTPHPHDAGVTPDHAASVDGGAVSVTDLGTVATWGTGSHLLAVQGINGDLNSSDASLIADLYLSIDTSTTITSDTTWTAANSPYIINDDLTIAPGATLTIEPGVRVQFDQGVGLTVNGRLLANGTENQRIYFTRNAGASRWKRILFIQADDSQLRHCVIEYADCEGDHKIYYDSYGQPNCQTISQAPRAYFQAVTAVATHLDIDWCIFQNLPNGGATAEGDAIAIISDDRQYPGEASANIRNCQFIGIGQAVHTRYSFVLVRDCYFTDHRGDNDDVDLYGESIPPPLILDNVMLNSHDDMINPTKCSAVLIGNIIGGSTDGGVVLRDRCDPVLINNIIFDIPSGGISVQNTCDALLVNNTIFNCGQGINFRNHTSRLGPPYCLTPGSGRARVTNCVIWNCSPAIRFENSGSFLAIDHSVVPGGQSGISVGASTLLWGANNLTADPLFVNSATNNFHLQSGSPAIDAGVVINATTTITNRSGVVETYSFSVTNDYDALGRPLDGNGDGSAAFDLGAFEYLLPTADSNGDGVPDGWYHSFGLNPANANVAIGNADHDPQTNGEEYIADTDPTNSTSYFRITEFSYDSPATLTFPSSANRVYTLLSAPGFISGSPAATWTAVPGQQSVPGSGGLDTLSDTNNAPTKFYQIKVSLP